MSTHIQGMDNLNPMQGSFPSGEIAGAPYVQFQGKVKLSAKRPDQSRVMDPSETAATKGKFWKRTNLRPIPASDSRLRELSLSLDGEWELCADGSSWEKVPVPGELFALGYDIPPGDWVTYRTAFIIPEDWEGRSVFLRFGMVWKYVEVIVNGERVGVHKGAFTTFDCDITSVVEPGQQAQLMVRCAHSESREGREGYPGNIGIIDGVTLYSLPAEHLTHLSYSTALDDAYTNAELKLDVEYSGVGENLQVSLIDPDQKEVNLAENSFPVSDGRAAISIPVAVPLKWDAEHPNLYLLRVEFSGLNYEMSIGFRTAERKGDELYINGVKTKLRGAALYGEDPILGRVFSKEQLERIVTAAKWANINFLRSSAYPERAALYELCDRYGIYVEECMPMNFLRGTWDSRFDQKVRPLSNLPAYEDDFLQQTAEVIERDRNHPSIIIWEYGNESDWGMNFKSVLEYMAVEDPTRLTAGTWDNRSTSLASYHYPQCDELISGAALYDEYAHLATHALETIRRDPGIRNAWGESVRRGWEAIYSSSGTVGAAIFAMGDMLLYRPGGDIFGWQYGQWGLLDSWLRDKPELWLTKKAYSPVKLPDCEIKKPHNGFPLAVPVQNRFNNTNLSEVSFEWKHLSRQGEVLDSGAACGPDTAPGFHGALILPAGEYQAGDQVEILVKDELGGDIDKYQLDIKDSAACPQAPAYAGDKSVRLNWSGDELTVYGERFSMTFSRSLGLLKTAAYDGKELLCGGPYLNLYGAYYKGSVFQNDQYGEFGIVPSGFACSGFDAQEQNGEARITISGSYPGGSHTDAWGFSYQFDPVSVQFDIHISGGGKVRTEFTIENPPQTFLYEVGVSYLLPQDMTEIRWKKKSVYSGYPEDHIGRPEGSAFLHRSEDADVYREKPAWRWSQDETNFPLYGSEDRGGHGTNDFIATREDVYFYSCLTPGDSRRVRVESDGASLAVRTCPAFNEDPKLPASLKLSMNTELYYDLGGGSSAIVKSGDGYLGNYVKPEVLLNGPYTAEVAFHLTDEEDKIKQKES